MANAEKTMGKADSRHAAYLVINPRSGYGSGRHALADLRAAAREAGVEFTEYTTRGPADATAYARSIAHHGLPVVVWGGDGTASEVANGLAGTDVPMLPCPAGTENLLAKELRVPSDPRGIIEVLRAGRISDCDIGMVNGRSFLLIIGVGFDGEVVRRLSAKRRGHISHLSYFWPVWRTFWEHDFPRMRITADGEELFDNFGLAFVGNISRYAVGLRICRDARFDDGLLDIVVFSCREQTALVFHAAWTLLRRHPLKGDVIYRRAQKAHIETQHPVPSQVDGDVGPNTPLDIELAPTRVKLLVPPPRPGWGFWPWKGDGIA